MDRKATAVWQGGLKDGKGRISTDSGVLKDAQYSFSTRFESGIGTNPEELIAAAHAGCFTMALSAQLTGANLKPESLETTAAVTFEKKDDKPTITKIKLTTNAKVPEPIRPPSTRPRRRRRPDAPSRGSSPATPRSRWTRSWFRRGRYHGATH